MKTIACLVALLMGLTVCSQVKIHVHLDSSIHRTLSGQLYIYTSTDTVKGVPNSPDLSNPQPMYAMDVHHLDRNNTVVVDDAARAFTLKLSQLKPGAYSIAGVIDTDPAERGKFNPGNYYSSKEAILRVSPEGKGEAHLYLNREAKRVFRENDSLKLAELKSELLSAFHKKDVFLKAAVLLPAGYKEQPERVYPVVYIIPGWGGTHYDAMGSGSRKRYGVGQGQPKIYVYLNPETQTPFGLHCFVDSRVNGPWGRALVEEMSVYIRKNYRATTDPQKTFVVGQSSGGYAALWLSLHYPKAFGGSWAVSPDPVDFSNFSGVKLYGKNANFYVSADGGGAIPFFINDGKPLTTLQKAIALETFEDDGGQFQSFEAEFGKPDKKGRPKQLFDRSSGRINKEVLKDWEPYDLGQFIAKHWVRLSPDLKGKKVHVYVGAEDNFLLHKAVEAFKEKAARINADVVVEIIPGANHFNVWSPQFTERVQSEMDELIKAVN